jgi:uncharacterized SAM-binding protein YcdF (DUF218 family)
MLRLAEPLFYPVGLIWLALMVATIHFYRKKIKEAHRFCLSLFALLTLFGCTPLPYLLLATLERPFTGATAQNARSADAALVLGGQTRASAFESAGFTTMSGFDRLLTGLDLQRLNKVQTLVLSGGVEVVGANTISEGARLEKFLRDYNLKGSEVIALSSSKTTHDEAVNFRALLAQRSWTNVLLVTSAYHMERSLAVFRKAGIPVEPVACEFISGPRLGTIPFGFQFIPTAEPLKLTGVYIHEIIGRLLYKLRGWA